MKKTVTTFRGTLIDVILKAFSRTEFTNLTKDFQVGRAYENIKEGFEEDLGFYIDKVTRRGKLHVLIGAMVQERPTDPQLIDVQEEFNKIYTADDNSMGFQETIFYRQVVNNQSILFIGREDFCKSISKMVNKKVIRMLGLKGLPQSGHSYVTKYFGEVAEDLKCFNYIDLNLRTISEDNGLDDTVSAEHLAAAICERLGMPVLPNFKFNSFFGALHTKLKELEEKEERWLFFIDQFSHAHKPDVEILLRKLGKMLIDYPNKFYLVFSVYKDWAHDWDAQDMAVTETVDFPSFSKEGIDIYLKKLYNCDAFESIRSEIDEESFLTSARNRLKPAYYEMVDESNVPAISTELKIWYRDLKENLNL